MLREYQELNASYKKTMIFHLGSRSGFFSEFNNMLLCMAYCLQNEIQFKLYSRDLSIAFQDGWADFFKPFCTETSNPLHRFFNSRFPRPTPQFRLRKTFGPLVKTITHCDFLTYELWYNFRALTQAGAISDLPIIGPQTRPIREVCHELIAMIWRLKPEIKHYIKEQAAHAQLPEKYVAVHIRAGDKIKEYKGSPLCAYIDKLKSVSDIRSVLVMTDDYRIYNQLTKYYTDCKFHTLESPKQEGYQHRKNMRQSPAQKKEAAIRFFTGIELAAQAEHFVGTFSSNVGTYLGMRMPHQRCHAVDRNTWRIE